MLQLRCRISPPPLRVCHLLWLTPLFYGTLSAYPHSSWAFGVAPIGSWNAYRWDAAPREFDGWERSLDGGLRYSLQTGSYEGFRDLFSWKNATPSVDAFAAAVQAAFDAWTITDPATGLGTALYFVPDLATPVDRLVDDDIRWGSEIDIFAATSAITWSTGDPVRRGEAAFSVTTLSLQRVTLTSGTFAYVPPITGADITLNCNPQALWDLPTFQTLLTHEIGHALGLSDVDLVSGPNGYFIDDNYDGSSSDSALATLTNSFAALIDPYDPRKSPLHMYRVADADPGMDTPGVDILMESRVSAAVINRLGALSNDDFAGRQFLYPYVIPEPASALILLLSPLPLFLPNRRA